MEYNPWKRIKFSKHSEPFNLFYDRNKNDFLALNIQMEDIERSGVIRSYFKNPKFSDEFLPDLDEAGTKNRKFISRK